MQLLVNRARSFIYSTSSPPALAAAASASLQILQSDLGDHLRARLWQNIGLLSSRLKIEGISKRRPESAIIPVLVGAEERSLRLAEVLLENGFLIPAIRYPTVARGSARLRLTLSAVHTSVDVQTLLRTLSTLEAQ